MGDEVKGIEGGQQELSLRALALNGHRQKPMPQRDPRPTGFAEGQGVLICRNVREPWEIEVVSEFAEIVFLIHHRSIQKIVDRGALELGGLLEKLANRWQVFTSASAGRFE